MAENTREDKNIEVKAVSEEGISAKNPKKEKKRITAEELMAKARHMQELSDDQDIIQRIEKTAAAFSEVDVDELLKGIQEIVDSDNEEAAAKKDAKKDDRADKDTDNGDRAGEDTDNGDRSDKDTDKDNKTDEAPKKPQ